MIKRFLSILLCLALVFGVLPLGLLTLPAAATEPPELTNLVGRWDGELYKISFDQVEGAEKYNFNWSMTMSTTRYASSYVDTVTESITKPYFYIGNNTDPPFWVTIIAYNKYGEQIAKSTLFESTRHLMKFHKFPFCDDIKNGILQGNRLLTEW